MVFHVTVVRERMFSKHLYDNSGSCSCSRSINGRQKRSSLSSASAQSLINNLMLAIKIGLHRAPCSGKGKKEKHGPGSRMDHFTASNCRLPSCQQNSSSNTVDEWKPPFRCRKYGALGSRVAPTQQTSSNLHLNAASSSLLLCLRCACARACILCTVLREIPRGKVKLAVGRSVGRCWLTWSVSLIIYLFKPMSNRWTCPALQIRHGEHCMSRIESSKAACPPGDCRHPFFFSILTMKVLTCRQWLGNQQTNPRDVCIRMHRLG